MSVGEEFRRQIALIARCEGMGHPEAYWVRRVVSNSGVHIQYWCDVCQKPVTQQKYGGQGQSRTADWFEQEFGHPASELPEKRMDVRYSMCWRCMETSTCEVHHIAPQAVFADAEDWPKVALCSRCHNEFTSGFETYVQRRIAQALRGRRAS